jgi:hypothetical protein
MLIQYDYTTGAFGKMNAYYVSGIFASKHRFLKIAYEFH